jgi:hypothetical protein
MSKRGLILLLASPNKGARTVKGSGIQGEEDGGRGDPVHR